MVNKLAPDLFVSIHINASTDTDIAGIETFCLSPTLFKDHASFSPEAGFKERRHLLYQHSHQAALAIHDNLVKAARTIEPNVQDRTVRHRVPQVLFGSNSPGLLVELGYLSHPQERILLQDKKYQQALVTGIAAGIDAYGA